MNQSLREARLAEVSGGWLAVMAGGGKVMMAREWEVDYPSMKKRHINMRR